MMDLDAIRKLNDPRDPWVRCLDAYLDNVPLQTLASRVQDIWAATANRLTSTGAFRAPELVAMARDAFNSDAAWHDADQANIGKAPQRRGGQ